MSKDDRTIQNNSDYEKEIDKSVINIREKANSLSDSINTLLKLKGLRCKCMRDYGHNECDGMCDTKDWR